MGLTFITDTGQVVPSVTVQQMIEVDRLAVEETGPNLFQMMENAGRNLALQAIDVLGTQWQQSTVMVLAGSGGNGGGGICAARHLANRGVKVRLCLSSPNRLKEVTAWQRQVFAATNGREISPSELDRSHESFDLIIDALIGYSLQAAPRGQALSLIQWANRAAIPILSLDTPSGLDATTGDTPGEWIRALWTLTLALPKTGLLPSKSGQVILADIGIPVGTYAWESLRIDYTDPFGDRFRVPLTAIDA